MQMRLKKTGIITRDVRELKNVFLSILTITILHPVVGPPFATVPARCVCALCALHLPAERVSEFLVLKPDPRADCASKDGYEKV
jgi:hypothetical protein